MLNKKNKRKVVSILLVVFMLLMTFPVGVFASEAEMGANMPTEENVSVQENIESATGTQDETIHEQTTEDSISTEENTQTLDSEKTMAPMAFATEMIAPASTVADDLKNQIESATSDLTINLDPGVYTFNSEIKNTAGIKVTLIGAVDGNGQPATQFVMDSSVTGNPRFIRLESGTLELNNIQITGTKGVNGGVSARNVISVNNQFINNYTNDGVNGGGAIRVTGGNLVITDSIFTGNSVGIYSDGGAVSAENSGNITINNSVFDSNERVGNQNQYGGAISVKNPGVAGSTISITNSAFTNNKLDASGNMTRGGAIQIYDQSGKLKSVVIDQVLFKNNTNVQNNGGALAFMAIQGATTTLVSNSTFIGNVANKYGGAIYYENSATANNNQIVNCTFVENNAKYILGNAGPSVAAYASKVTIDSSTLIKNLPNTQGTGSVITIKDSILSDSTASNTGGSGSIVYTGTNLMKLSAADPAVPASSVFSAYTGATLVKVSDYVYVAPILTDGAAYKKVGTARTLATAQNGLERKSPLSDLGAYEAPNFFTVSFDANNGDAVQSESIEEGNLAIQPATPFKVGNFVFSGWYTDNGTFNDAWDFSNRTVTADVTLYAKWVEKTYDLSFDLNGTSDTPPATQTLVEGAVGTAVTDPSRVGYLFDGWNTTADGSGTSWVPGTTPMIPEDVVLYAQWQPGHYLVHFDAHGGSGTMTDEDYAYGETKPLFKQSFTKEGHTFIGWSLTEDGAVTFTDEAMYTLAIANDVTLYAQWQVNNYKVHFDANGGLGTMTDETYTFEETKALAKQAFTKEGFTFIGWSTTPNGGVEYKDEAMYKQTLANDVILYAQWQENGKPVPPTPPTPTPDNNKGNVNPIFVSKQLPQTGGNGFLLFSLMTLGAGAVASIKGFRKK